MPALTEQTVNDIIRLVEEALEDISERMRKDVGQAPVYDDEDRCQFLEMSDRVGAALPILRDLPGLRIAALAQPLCIPASDGAAPSVHPAG